MEFEDRIYGSKTVKKEVLKELIKSRPVQRLKDVHQAGPVPFFEDKKKITRFDHSLGVMFLLRDHGASIEEQIAGLLHDVPHTAFSHVADFVFNDEDHEYHDKFLEKIVYNSEIPEILEKHSLSTEYILDESNFKLLERDAPDLCADRIDYFLRDSKNYGNWNISHLLDNLTTADNHFVLKDKETAEDYALKYIKADETWWANPKEVAIFEIFADIIRKAMDEGILTEEELFGTDDEVMRKIESSENKQIQEKLRLLKNGIEVELNAEEYDFEANTKARYVDPYVLTDSGLTPISELSDRVSTRIEKHRKEVSSGYKIKIV